MFYALFRPKVLVRKILDGLTSKKFKNYFIDNKDSASPGNKGALIFVSKIGMNTSGSFFFNGYY